MHTKNALEISESLAGYLLACHIYTSFNENPRMEQYMSHTTTSQFSIADIYFESKDTAIEMKATAHGNSALKGVVQASVYKEQATHGVFCMQKPHRRKLSRVIEGLARDHGVGVIWIIGVPDICSKNMVARVTGVCENPFYKYKGNSYLRTKNNIIRNSRTDMIEEYLDTIEAIISENSDNIFEFAVEPDDSIGGLSDIH